MAGEYLYGLVRAETSRDRERVSRNSGRTPRTDGREGPRISRRRRRTIFSRVLSFLAGIALVSQASDARGGQMFLDPNYVIDYAGVAPAGATLKVTANASYVRLGQPVAINYGQTFNIAGLTSAQAIKLILNSAANPTGLVTFGSNAISTPVPPGPAGITISTLLGLDNNQHALDKMKGIDLDPNAAAAALGLKTAAAMPLINDPFGRPTNTVTVSVDPGSFMGGVTAGKITLDLNNVAINATVGANQEASTVLGNLENAVATSGFVLSSMTSDSFTIDFSNATNFDKLGEPSSFQFDLGLNSGASNLDFGLGVSAIPEPDSLVLAVIAVLCLVGYRAAPSGQGNPGRASARWVQRARRALKLFR
jgi:hypothetical protein